MTLERNGCLRQERVKSGAYYRCAVETLRLLGGAMARYPLLTGRSQIDGTATAYVCESYTCQLPVTEAEALRAQLEQR